MDILALGNGKNINSNVAQEERHGSFRWRPVWVVVAVFVGTMLSALYPAWKATRIEPVETIKLV